jgi:hypothetical protein
MSATSNLKSLLRARRNDLIDGFPCKAALLALALSADPSEKLDMLNAELLKDNVKVKFTVKSDLAKGFKEAGLNGALAYASGEIDIFITPTFFEIDNLSPLERALRFQSMVVHELVHRNQFRTKTAHARMLSDQDMSDYETYLNDELELNAMAAEVSHDMIVKKYFVNIDTIHQASPRLLTITDNAKLLTKESIEKFSEYLKSWTPSKELAIVV